jgi:hypothetical protein
MKPLVSFGCLTITPQRLPPARKIAFLQVINHLPDSFSRRKPVARIRQNPFPCEYFANAMLGAAWAVAVIIIWLLPFLRIQKKYQGCQIEIQAKLL